MKDQKNDNSKPVFILKMKYTDDKIKYPCKLETETLAYFTELKKAEYYIAFHRKDAYWFLEDKPFKIFEIETSYTNYFLLYYSTRIYDKDGKFIGEHFGDETSFFGREAKDCQFKPGDLIEYVNGNSLTIGIVAGLPPNKKEAGQILNKEKKRLKDVINVLSVLDSRNDCYSVLTGHKKSIHDHPQVYYCYPPSAKITPDYEKQLKDRYKKIKRTNIR